MASKYNFLAEPGDRFICLICREVASDPKQHGDCGKLFCSECLEKNGNNPCPNCMAENPQYFPDGKSLREIRDMGVRCEHVDRGCDWAGTVRTLGDHVDKCGFTSVPCPNKCKVEGEVLQLIRNDLHDHLKNMCPNRGYVCKHCQKKGTFASITEEHDSVCFKKRVSCPNTKCNLLMKRRLTKTNVETVCRYTVVACKYVSIGCSVRKMRMDMKEHEEDDKSHFPIGLEKIMKLESKIVKLESKIVKSESKIVKSESKIVKLESKIVKLEDTTSSQITSISSLEDITSVLKQHLETLNREKSITFSLPGYGKKKEGSEIFYSEPFYTSPGGYKMRIQVHPNGNGDGEDTHVSMFFELLEGPKYGDLPWPFLGTITFCLLNQLSDENHHSMNLSITSEHNARVHNNPVWGVPKFLPHTKLSQDHGSNTLYLVADTLYFRVPVEVDHHKPWLDCTHPTPQGHELC